MYIQQCHINTDIEQSIKHVSIV